ncbi:5-hydroxytryptamine receptor 1F [Nematostella vectensis]|uniref:5-hydroxytryptamine receptor 1F n=1 Tax=Nematostella vectensis TaxID=45351 RepID=UPI002077139A|nr:5-hydroxytryptamine receptor 1F [Nematostella vectensis]
MMELRNFTDKTVFNYACYHFTEWVQEGQITRPEFIIIAVLNGITILPAILLNALVLFSIWRTPTLHTPAMVLLCNLALSDFAVGIIAQPITVTSVVLELSPSVKPASFCSIAVFYGITSSLFAGVSLLSITAVAVDRFLALHLHLRLVRMSTVIVLANSATNPAIYCWKIPELRNAVRDTLVWLGCNRRRGGT